MTTTKTATTVTIASSTIPYPPAAIFMRQHIIYAIIGIIVTASNLPIIAAWAMKKALRSKKEMVLIVALAITDAIFGLGNVCAAAERIPTYLQADVKLVTYLQCYFRPHNIFWTIGTLGSATIQLVISVDRYIAIRYFNTYKTYGRGYTIKLACITGLWVLLVWFLFFIDLLVNARNNMALPVCWDNTRFTDWGYKIYGGYLTVTTFVACVVYLIVMWELKRQQAQSEWSQHSQTQAKYQRKITKLLAVVTLSTALLFVIPSIFYLAERFLTFDVWFDYIGGDIYLLNSVIVCIMSLNSSINVVIYFVKNNEMRNGMIDFMLCRWKKAQAIGPALGS